VNAQRSSIAPILTILVLLALVLGTTTGCTQNADAQETDSGEAAGDTPGEAHEKPVPVELAVLGLGPIESVLRFSANLEAEAAVEVHAQAARLITELRVEEGDLVREGDLLARLQDEEQRSELAKVRVELAKANREYEQQKRLYAESLISEQEFNDATYEKEQLELRLSDAERELAYAEVRAPVAGTVTRRNIQIGDPVQVGQHLFDIVDFDSLVARVYVPEKHLSELVPGIQARIAAPSLARTDYRGAVDRVAPVVDPKTGTVKVTVAVGRQSGLRPGLYVDVDLVTAVHPEALLLPKRALVFDDEQTYAFRMNDEGRAERVRVQTVLSDKRWVEPGGGFAAGDRIVVAGQTGLKPGALLEAADTEPEVESAPQVTEDDGDKDRSAA
jgi:membrane fusion protein (multidrug efflux system)